MKQDEFLASEKVRILIRLIKRFIERRFKEVESKAYLLLSFSCPADDHNRAAHSNLLITALKYFSVEIIIKLPSIYIFFFLLHNCYENDDEASILDGS